MDTQRSCEEVATPSTPADGREVKRGRTVVPFDAREEVELKAANSIVAASERVMDAAEMIKNCLNELKDTLNSFGNASGEPAILITKGPSDGEDLALIQGATAEILGRRAARKLWTEDELKRHMLSPKGKAMKNIEPRKDFSPIRKESFNGSSINDNLSDLSE